MLGLGHLDTASDIPAGFEQRVWMDGCTDIQDPANMSLTRHMLSHRTLSLETLLWARRVCWPWKFPPQTCKAHQARSDQPRLMQALSLEQVIADSAPLSCLIGDVRDSASVLTRIHGYVGRLATAAAPQMATIIDNPIQAAAAAQEKPGTGAEGKFAAAVFEGDGLDVSLAA